MTTEEALEKFKLQINDKVSNIKKEPVNTKNQFLKFGIQSTLQTLWSNFPKIDSLNQLQSKDFGSSYKLLTLQKLEATLYEKGIAALRSNWLVADILDYAEINGKIKYLKTKLEFNNSKAPIYVFETFEYKNDKLIFDYSVIKPDQISDKEAKDILFNFCEYKPTTYIEIPYKIFL